MTHAPALSDPAAHFSWRAGIVAFGLYVVFLTAHAPAAMLAWALAHSSNGSVSLYGVEGTLWRGRAATFAVRHGSDSTYRFERLQWELHGMRLIVGEVALRVEIDDPNLRGVGRFSLRTDGVRTSDASFRLPAASLPAYQPELSLAGVSGDIQVQSEGFTFGNQTFAGTATLEWRNAATAMSSVRPLGDYRVFITGAGARAEFRVATVKGMLRVEGRGGWARDEGLSFQGSARSESGNQSDLAELLKLLGPDRGGGAHEFSISARAGQRVGLSTAHQASGLSGDPR